MTTILSFPTRKDFLKTLAAAAMVPEVRGQMRPGKILIVVAHPDDEYAFAATTYRLVRELGWTADQVVITNGEGGYRYAALAEVVYGVPLAHQADGRTRLPAIRKEETIRAGKILGIRRHYFLDQEDSGFETDASTADSTHWHRERVLTFLTKLLTRVRYDVIFTLRPTEQTHGHHLAAALLVLEAVSGLAPGERPLVFGADARTKHDPRTSTPASRTPRSHSPSAFRI